MLRVEFRCRGCQLEDGQRELMEERLSRLAKYVGEPERAEIFMERELNQSVADRVHSELTVWTGKHVARARAAAADEMAAFDVAEQRLKRQLERLKGRLVGRSHPHHRQGKVEDLDAVADSVEISKVKSFELDELDPETAAFRMELLGHSFYLFMNAATKRAAVVYRRSDGTIGLIDQAEEVEPDGQLAT